jgi:branched-chain amino acid transport system ATP-binding protein/branched-chain amino acid transport system permease protein
LKPLLEVRDLAVHYRGIRALDGVTATVAETGITGLIGPNGAGKSTLFNVVSGLVRPTRGTVRFAGTDLVGVSPSQIARMGISRTFQTPRAFPSLDLVDNLCVSALNPAEGLGAALLRRFSRAESELRERASVLLERVRLADQASRRADELSGGELRMLEVARQLMRQPRLLLLDEPTAGVNHALQERLAALLTEIAADGTSILIVEHNLHFLLALAERVIVLHQGRTLTEGTPAEVRSDPAVISAYLGRSTDAA